ncbi:hypothetical protein B0A49_06618 [Cryomyces minteri]|uniref:Uncharacterized protein n=1 Tax=Cryomyces minteri TaxID=331657 RepID=A0A4U0X8C0_9PEZI|nr:hypothetical protein B0A49_06618 [Cryomyces minteri]
MRRAALSALALARLAASQSTVRVLFPQHPAQSDLVLPSPLAASLRGSNPTATTLVFACDQKNTTCDWDPDGWTVTAGPTRINWVLAGSIHYDYTLVSSIVYTGQLSYGGDEQGQLPITLTDSAVAHDVTITTGDATGGHHEELCGSESGAMRHDDLVGRRRRLWIGEVFFAADCPPSYAEVSTEKLESVSAACRNRQLRIPAYTERYLTIEVQWTTPSHSRLSRSQSNEPIDVWSLRTAREPNISRTAALDIDQLEAAMRESEGDVEQRFLCPGNQPAWFYPQIEIADGSTAQYGTVQ